MAANKVQTYARVINGKIIEWPVYKEYIERRGDPMSFYTPVIDNGEPAHSPFEATTSQVVFLGTQLVEQYSVFPLPLEMLLMKAWGAVNPSDLNGFNDTSLPPPDISKIDPSLATAIQTSVQTRVQEMLDNFAAKKGYSSITSLCGYTTSAIPNFAEEGKIGMAVRDQTWASLYTYLAQVSSGAAPFIKNFQEVAKILPVMSWIPALDGNAPVQTGQSLTLTIVNYNAAITYTVSASSGTVTQSGHTLTYTAPGTAGDYTLTINETIVTIAVQDPPAAATSSSPTTTSGTATS